MAALAREICSHLRPGMKIHCISARSLSRGNGFVDQNARSAKMLGKLLGSRNPSQRKVLHPTAVVVAKGAPQYLTQTHGHAKSITRRQSMLNKHFMASLSDVLATESIGNELIENGVRITQIEVGKHYNYANIFWTAEGRDITEVGRKLNMLTGRLFKYITERNFMGKVPIIKFNYDQTTAVTDNVQKILKEADYGKNFVASDPRKFSPPTQVLTGKERLSIKPDYRKLAAVLYDENTAAINSINLKKPDYKVLTFAHPENMNLNVLGIDYLGIMNKVLFFMKRSRAEHRGFVPIADPLPPAEWIAPPPFSTSESKPDLEPSSEDRIALMRKFVIENKKKRQRMSRDSRNFADLCVEEVAETLDVVKESLESKYSETDQFEEDYLDEEEYK